MAKKGSNKQLTRATHKGRGTRTGNVRSGVNMADKGRGVKGTHLGVTGTAKLTSPLLTGGLSPTPKGPEPGRGGTMY